MILITHRGNIQGPNKDSENSPDYIREALSMGFNVEVDAHLTNNRLYLGHNEPTHLISEDFLNNKKLWSHAKNFNALSCFLELKFHCFWHEGDDYTITSKGFIWAYPSKLGLHNTIAVIPEGKLEKWDHFSGVCSYWVQSYG